MQPTNFHIASTTYRSILPVPPSVGPTISLELDVEDGEVENYEVRESAVTTFGPECCRNAFCFL